MAVSLWRMNKNERVHHHHQPFERAVITVSLLLTRYLQFVSSETLRSLRRIATYNVQWWNILGVTPTKWNDGQTWRDKHNKSEHVVGSWRPLQLTWKLSIRFHKIPQNSFTPNANNELALFVWWNCQTSMTGTNPERTSWKKGEFVTVQVHE